MTPVLIGNTADARGLSLAGVDAYVCSTPEEVERCLDDVLRGVSQPMIIFSFSTAGLIAGRCAEWRRNGTGPLFVTLPA